MKGSRKEPVILKAKKEIDELSQLFTENLRIKNIDLINSIPENLCIEMDLNHFKIVFRNLISNAIKFTHEGGKITLEGETSDDKTVIRVRDNGVGISEDNVKKIWDYKQHLSTFGTNAEKGTGLGLMLCKEMVEKNEGAIWVESAKNKGTTFNITLPPCR
jgi:signal transduction histidine kinase